MLGDFMAKINDHSALRNVLVDLFACVVPRPRPLKVLGAKKKKKKDCLDKDKKNSIELVSR